MNDKENPSPMDTKGSAKIYSVGMTISETTARDEYGKCYLDNANEAYAPMHSRDSQGILIVTQRNSHEKMKDSYINETDDEHIIPGSFSPNSHSTRCHSPIKTDSVSSTMSPSSEIIPYGVESSSHHDNGNDNDVAFRSSCSHDPDNYGGNISMPGGKTVSSDELHSETNDGQVLNENSDATNRMRSDSMAYNSRESEHSPSLSGKTLRRGKWTQEEEAFVARAIHDFNCGFLNVAAGTTLRTYLSDKLQCNPMRVTKKFTGDSCIGKRVFHPAVRTESNAATIDKAQMELEALEGRWRRRLEAQHRDSQKKVTSSTLSSAHSNPLCLSGSLIESAPSQLRNNASDLTQAVSWLEKANAVLSQDTSEQQDYETEMQQVQRLIFEAPIIHNISIGLPRPRENSLSIIPTPGYVDPSTNPNINDDYDDPTVKRKVAYKSVQISSSIHRIDSLDKKENPSIPALGSMDKSPHESGSIQLIPNSLAKDEKRLRTSNIIHQEITPHSVNEAVAEDAATLMDFLFSVRNEAAAASKT